MTGRTSRTKGQTYERAVAAAISEALEIPVQRKLGAARDGGDDIQVGQFRFECKRTEKAAPWAWYEQAKSNSGPGDIPVVVFRRSRSDSMVLMSFSDFLRMMREFV